MVTEAASAGQFEMDGYSPVPRIQIVSIEQAMDLRDRALRLPARRDDAFRKAAREEDGKAQGKGDGKGKRDTSSGTIHVLEGGRLKALVVQLGISDGRSTEIAGGELKAGDRSAVGEALPQADNKSGSPVRMRLF